MSTVRLLSLLFLTLLLGTGCSNTKLTSSWQDPELTKLGFTKLVALGISTDAALRVRTENAMVQALGSRAHPSYTLLPHALSATDADLIAEAVAGFGADGVVTMRLLSAEKELSYVPGQAVPTYYMGMNGYYNGYWNSYAPMYTPGYYVENKLFAVEVNLYDVARRKLIYSAITRTTDPMSDQDLIDGVARAVRIDLRDRHLLTK
jgi:hypothetical protein